jgi:hypothetical protein
MNYRRKLLNEMAFMPYTTIMECVAVCGREWNCTSEWDRIVTNARIMCGLETEREKEPYQKFYEVLDM